MTEQDLEQIEQRVDKVFNRRFNEFWECYLEPAFTRIDKKFVDIDNRFDIQDSKIDNLPTREYVDNKIAGLKLDLGMDMNRGFINQDIKINKLTDALLSNKALTHTQSEQVKQIKFSPPIPKSP